MLLNSLFCIHGRDTSLRFVAISASCFFVILLWMLIFGSNASVFIPAVTAGIVLLLSGYRRVRDAQKPQWWSVTLLVPWLALSVSISSDTLFSIWLSMLIFGCIATLLLAFPKSLSVGRFSSGYQGPATKMHGAQSTSTKRVEPSLNAQFDSGDSEQAPNYWPNANESTDALLDREPMQQDSMKSLFSDMIESSPINRKTLLFIVITLLSLTVLGLLGQSMWGDHELDTVSTAEQAVIPTSEPEVTVSFSDGFSMGLSDKKLSMTWLGDEGEAQTLWTLADAIGDSNCQVLRFNNGTQYRTIKVERLSDSSTKAWFTPLDTKAILKDVARRNKASLCSYTFSLKGSQADLSKEPLFRAYIE
ncbi:hypothetical protein D5R81_12080 [Parashewanella spongiae]|uniref:DUF805 domain-containing protein n=1 Tax=Parashewanella spongiae TaxID=342950 RepID=A0A3A6TNR2_9GAMM|nr:hypothetical protein [Parashewanella spongiae]MCL1078627.1 hypothetical protein [Parashewanella spongiae]RJY12980.1 hypothetical protein D5R81_12080 [Parashewanella spongiae]